MIKRTKVFLRLWVAATSLAALLFGWAVLAHAPKPAPLLRAQPVSGSMPAVQLPAIPSLQQLQANSPSTSSGFSLSYSPAPSTSASPPRLRTMGS